MLKFIFGLIVLGGLIYIGRRAYNSYISNQNINKVKAMRDQALVNLEKATANKKAFDEKLRLENENVIKKEKDLQDECAGKMKEVSDKDSLSAWEVFNSYSDDQKEGCLTVVKSSWFSRYDKIREEDKEWEKNFFDRLLEIHNVDEWVIRAVDLKDIKKAGLSVYKKNKVSVDDCRYYETFDNFTDDEKKVCYRMKSDYHYSNDKEFGDEEVRQHLINKFNEMVSDERNAVLWETAEHIDRDYILFSV